MKYGSRECLVLTGMLRPVLWQKKEKKERKKKKKKKEKKKKKKKEKSTQ